MKLTKILVTGGFVATLILANATSAFAWKTEQTATATCNPSGSGVMVNAEFINTEPKNHPELDMKVSATFQGRDMQVTSLDDIAESGGHNVRFELGLEQYNDLLPGQVKFNLSWANGHKGSDVRYVTTNSVESCKDIILPGLEWSIEQPECDDNDVSVTVISGDGNEPTFVELVALPDTVLFSGKLQPNTTQVVDRLAIASGGTVTVQLFQEGKFVDEQSITAPSEEECHVPAPSAVFNGSVDCDNRVNGVLTIDRDGLAGNFHVIVNDGDIEALLDNDSLEIESVSLPFSIKLFSPRGEEMDVSTAIVGQPDDCIVPTTTPPTTIPTPPAPTTVPPTTPVIDELPYTGAGSTLQFMIGLSLLGVGGLVIGATKSRGKMRSSV